MPTLVSVCALAAGLATVGAVWCFADPRSYIAFWTLVSLTVVTARQLVRRLSPQSRSDYVVSVSLASLATVVSCGLLLGAVGHLSLTALLILQATLCGV